MPMEKQSLINFLPDGFETLNQEGYKENFSADKIATGYEKDIKDRVTGPNLNNLIDVIGKNTNTLNNYVDYLNNMPISSVPYVNANNQLDYQDVGQLSNKADKNLVNTGMITNCLLEIPQRIKYDLTDGTLTLKVGTVVIVPYGTEDLTADYPVGSTFLNDNFKVYDTQFADGKFFVWAEFTNDIIVNPSSQTTASRYLSVYFESGKIYIGEKTYSGTSTTAGSTYSLYYNTSTNYVNSSDSTTTVNTEYTQSFPFMIATNSISTGTTSIEQVFNGIGYIGSTIWVDKGVKGLIPNKRNEDGTLKNVEWTNDKIRTASGTATGDFDIAYQLYNDTFGMLKTANWSFNEDENIYVYTDGVEYTVITFGNVTLNAGVISNFNPKQPIRLVDYNDVQSTRFDGQWVSSQKTLSTSTAATTITVDLSDYLPNDGCNYEVKMWFYFYDSGDTAGKVCPETDIFLNGNAANKTYGLYSGTEHARHNCFEVTLPVGTGRWVKISFGDANSTRYWWAIGYRRIGTNV